MAKRTKSPNTVEAYIAIVATYFDAEHNEANRQAMEEFEAAYPQTADAAHSDPRMQEVMYPNVKIIAR